MTTPQRIFGGSAAILFGLLLVLAARASSAGDDSKGAREFDSPEAAMKELVAALKANDDDALKALTGPGSDDLVQSGKDASVARERRRAATMIDEKVVWETLDDGTKVAVIGMKAFPMAVPLAPRGDKWFFDAEQGRDEVLARRIGADELNVMALMRVAVEAQEAYKSKDRDGDGVLEYAQKAMSTEGKHDGLYWADADDSDPEERSPLGTTFAELEMTGQVAGTPYSGYAFHWLFSQDESARDGAQSFLEGENLTKGWIVIAVPVEYRNTGVMSFMISHRNRLMESNLGPKGLEEVKAMTVFSPKGKWTPVVEAPGTTATPGPTPAPMPAPAPGGSKCR